MIDYDRFDEWVAQHDDDKEAFELTRVVVESVILVDALLGHDAAAAIARQVIHSGLESAYGRLDADEALTHLDLGDPFSAIEQLFFDVDLLNFEFAQKANALKCFAMTGMIESEDPSASFEEKRNHLGELVEWGRMICDMVPEQRAELSDFRSIVAASDARLSIDLGHPVETVAFANLASLFREGTAEQVRKTIQNQISARQLEVNERRQLLPESALMFLRGAPGFPSIWMLSEQSDSEDGDVAVPIFIPVAPATFSREEQPFLPSERHADGYRIGAGENARTIVDYWEALECLAHQSEPTFQPVGQERPLRCRTEWRRVDRQLLLNELSSAKASPDAPRSLTEQIHSRIMRSQGINVHPLGHTSKLYRFKADDGSELALEKRIGEPWLYLRADGAPDVEGVAQSDVPGNKQGRHSNLNAMPSFAGNPLRKYKLASVGDLERVLSER